MAKPPKIDAMWPLPNVTGLVIRRATYKPPLKFMIRGKLVDWRKGVEIQVETDGPIPVRALTPALFVGDAELDRVQALAETSHRFFALDESALKAGAPILLGWSGDPPPPEAFEKAKYRYQPPV